MADALEDTRKRVVVIGEDDEPIAILLRDALNDEPGYQALVVTDGRRVVDTVASVRADLLILDIMMPGLSGFEIFDHIRRDPSIAATPVLFISAAAGHYTNEFATRGITDVIAKPFDLSEFLARVEAICPASAD
jgi:DNA-binding response OmpR family regulator